MRGKAVYEEFCIGQTFIRQYNIQRVLSALELCQPLTRADIARMTDMSLASVTRIIGALNSLGLVEETGVGDSVGRGRRALGLRPRADGIYTLGFHIDTKALRMCVMDFSGRACFACETPLHPGRLEPEDLAALARAQMQRIPQGLLADTVRLMAAGVALSGRVDAERGCVLRSEAFDWTAAEAGAAFSCALGLPVRIENDVKACLTWEKERRNIPDTQDIAYLYIGRTGIGFANTANGVLVRGRSNASGEIEETRFTRSERLSDHLMERQLIRRAQAVSPSVTALDDILCAAHMGLPWARMLMDDFTDNLRVLLQVIETMLDPHLIILGGDVPEAFAGVPGLLPGDRYCIGERFEESCAYGAAIIAMREAVHRMISDMLEP